MIFGKKLCKSPHNGGRVLTKPGRDKRKYLPKTRWNELMMKDLRDGIVSN